MTVWISFTLNLEIISKRESARPSMRIFKIVCYHKVHVTKWSNCCWQILRISQICPLANKDHFLIASDSAYQFNISPSSMFGQQFCSKGTIFCTSVFYSGYWSHIHCILVLCKIKSSKNRSPFQLVYMFWSHSFLLDNMWAKRALYGNKYVPS
jgi:hypothetical protein